MKHSIPQHYPDPYGNGQAVVARIHLNLSEQGMAKAAPDAFDTGYQNPLWRAAKRRIFYTNRSDYERAKAILSDLNALPEGYTA
ncbi:hypothetical protein [Ruegeria sp.]|uniref:hypothetical protein n=1 Tax=Ruegeria sp. TaxID=1879320 RepID=UPI003B5B8B79